MPPRLRHSALHHAALRHLALACSALPLLALAGCAERAVMRPVAIEAGATEQVDMLVATTRKASANPGILFSGERGSGVQLTNVVVSIPPDGAHKPGTIQWPTSASPDPERVFVTTRAAPIPRDDVDDWFARTAAGTGRVLVFVHGFNTGYADATYRFAQIVHDIDTPAAPVLFTWPSKASALGYVYDRESTTYSRFGLAMVLQEAIEAPQVREITVVGHSMGSWLTMEALRDLAQRNGELSRKINTVVLASPDIDMDVFRRQVVELGPHRPSIRVIYSRADTALALSRFIAGDVDRLGGADLREHQAELAADGITVIDTTDTPTLDLFGHNDFAESGELLRQLAADVAHADAAQAGGVQAGGTRAAGP